MEGVVNSYLKEHSSNGGPPPGRAKYQRLVSLCNQAYQQRLTEEVGGDPQKFPGLMTQQEARLLERALEDRIRYPQLGAKDTHRRDLAAIRAMQELGISLGEAAERVADIHPLADKYEGYFSSTRKEVVWPGQDTF